MPSQSSPSFEHFVKHLERFGPEGILETAKSLKLPDAMMADLECRVKEEQKRGKVKK